MTPEQLKASILQMAIEGRLVPQLDDEPAVEIDTAEPEEVPFAIPEKWKWVKLREIGITQTGTTPPTSKKSYYGNDIPFVKPGDIIDNKVYYRNEGLSYEGIAVGRTAVADSVLMVCIGGTIGKVCRVDREVSFNQQINSITPDTLLSFGEFIFFTLASDYFYKLVWLKATGTATPIIKKSTWQDILVPLPPIAEQRRIVTRLNEILPIIEEYGKSYTSLKRIEKALPDQLRASLLQEAIQGKLVPQLDDEPAVEIDTAEPDEVPFAIPEKWKWARLGGCIKLTSGRDLDKIFISDEPNGIPYITGASQIEHGKIIVSRWTDKPTVISHKGDLLLTCKGTVGKVAINNVGKLHIARQIMALIPHAILEIGFLKVFMLYAAARLSNVAKSMIPGISRKDVLELPIPLPSLAEQRRIVARLEELLPYVRAIAGVR